MISIVIPTRNEEKILGTTLVGLKAKLTIPHEIIVSDGKSTDKTIEIARRFIEKVVTYEGTERQTIAAGRNAGAKAAQGEFIAFMDADCRLEDPDRSFAMALGEFSKDPRLVAQAAWIKVFPERQTFSDKIFWNLMNNSFRLSNILGKGAAGGELQIIRKSAFISVGGYNERLVASEDVDMFRRLSKIGKVRTNPKLVVFHSGRHGHAWGWPKMLSMWFLNTVSYAIRGKSASKEWEEIR